MGTSRVGQYVYTCPQCGIQFRMTCAKADYTYIFVRKDKRPKVAAFCGAECLKLYAASRRTERGLTPEPMNPSDRARKYRQAHREAYRSYQNAYSRRRREQEAKQASERVEKL